MKPFLLSLAAVLCVSLGTVTAQTIVINSSGSSAVDPDKTVVEVTLSDWYFEEPGNPRPVEYEMQNIESNLFALIRTMHIPEKNLVFKSNEQIPSFDEYSPAYSLRKYNLTFDDVKKYRDFTTSVYTVSGANYVVTEITVEDLDGLMKSAYSKAFADARQRSERMAALSGLKLGALISLEDLSGPYYPPTMINYYEGESIGADQCSFTANLKLTYAVVK